MVLLQAGQTIPVILLGLLQSERMAGPACCRSVFSQANKLYKYSHIEGFRPKWCISTMIYSRDTPFWSEILDTGF